MTTQNETPTPAAPEQPAAAPAAPAAAPAAEPRMVPESALITQGQELKELKAYREQAETAKKVEADALALEQGKFKELAAAKDTELAGHLDTIKKLERSTVQAAAKDQLRALGMNDALSLKGALVDLPGDSTAETVTAWAADLAKASPGYFKAPANPTAQPTAGAPHSGESPGRSVKDALHSPIAKDPQKWGEAVKQARELRARGIDPHK